MAELCACVKSVYCTWHFRTIYICIEQVRRHIILVDPTPYTCNHLRHAYLVRHF